MEFSRVVCRHGSKRVKGSRILEVVQTASGGRRRNCGGGWDALAFGGRGRYRVSPWKAVLPTGLPGICTFLPTFGRRADCHYPSSPSLNIPIKPSSNIFNNPCKIYYNYLNSMSLSLSLSPLTSSKKILYTLYLKFPPIFKRDLFRRKKEGENVASWRIQGET